MSKPVKREDGDEDSTIIGEFRGQWKSALVAFVLGLIFLQSLGFLQRGVRATVPFARAGWCALGFAVCDLSYAQALAAARSVASIGPDAIDAIPFRDEGSDEQYIAVAVLDKTNRSFSAGIISVHLLREASGSYLDEKTKLAALPPLPTEIRRPIIRRDFGVDDMNGDGHMEVYAVRESIGSAMQTWWVTVLDRQSGVYYRAYGLDNLNTVRPNIHVPSSVPFPIQGWMVRKIDDLAGVGVVPTQQVGFYRALTEWIDDNGYGAIDRLQSTGDNAVLRVRTYQGKPPMDRWSHATLRDGAADWILFFKGPVVLYDRRRHVYSVVINSQSGAWYGVRSAIAGKRYLWLQEETVPLLLVYDKQSHVVEAVRYRRVPDPMALLRIHGDELYVDKVRINVPRNIKLRHEFDHAKRAEGF